jgi:hypothetical protein
MEAVNELLRIDPDHSYKRSLDSYRDGAIENAPVPERMQPLVELLKKHSIDQ